MHQRYIGVRLQDRNLFLQFLGVTPEIIARTVCNVFSPALKHAVEVVVYKSFVFLVRNNPDDVRVLLGVLLTNSQSGISGTVFTNDNLIRYMTLLHEDRIQCATYRFLLIIGNDND
jgi:hypothetical protein